MDQRKAKSLEKDLMGKRIGGYEIIEFINYGKSAVVFKAKDFNENIIALKIFDEELIGLTGQEIQERRIKQELSLQEHTIDGLVKIISGGKHNDLGRDYHFIAMEYIAGKNLKKFIESENYNEGFIKKILKSLVTITEELIIKGLAHRDIKPENVMIDKNGNLILMD